MRGGRRGGPDSRCKSIDQPVSLIDRPKAPTTTTTKQPYNNNPKNNNHNPNPIPRRQGLPAAADAEAKMKAIEDKELTVRFFGPFFQTLFLPVCCLTPLLCMRSFVDCC